MSPWDADRDGSTEASWQLACFYVGAQQYALDIMRIKEIINPVPIAKVPNAPEFIEGVIELRGAFFAVIDLRRRFGLEAGPLTRESKIIVVTLAGQNIGLVVDRVLEVRRIAKRDIGAAPELALGPGSQFGAGVMKWDREIVMLLDLDQVLSMAEKSALAGL